MRTVDMVGSRCGEYVIFCKCDDMDERLNKLLISGEPEISGRASFLILSRTLTMSMQAKKPTSL